jgi:homoprotocatechuate degradation regulator HpaR
MSKRNGWGLPAYSESIAGSLLAAREAVMAPIRPHLRKAGVTEQQWRVLRVVNDNGSLEISAIATQALLYPPSVTRILKDLLARGLVARRPDPHDARKFWISTTPEGGKLVRETASETGQLLKQYTEAFGPERLAAFREEARHLAQCLKQFSPND